MNRVGLLLGAEDNTHAVQSGNEATGSASRICSAGNLIPADGAATWATSCPQ